MTNSTSILKRTALLAALGLALSGCYAYAPAPAPSEYSYYSYPQPYPYYGPEYYGPSVGISLGFGGGFRDWDHEHGRFGEHGGFGERGGGHDFHRH